MNKRQTQEIIVEIGKIYTLRNGLKTSPIRLAGNGTNYMFEADINGLSECWLKNGKYLTNFIEHEKDIVF